MDAQRTMKAFKSYRDTVGVERAVLLLSEQGCPPEGIHQILLEEGYEPELKTVSYSGAVVLVFSSEARRLAEFDVRRGHQLLLDAQKKKDKNATFQGLALIASASRKKNELSQQIVVKWKATAQK